MSPEEFADKLTLRAHAAGLVIPDELIERLHSYAELLTFWNRKINLTSMDLQALPPEAVDRLLIEPLAAARYVGTGVRIIDIGSGGGSPGIPFALATQAASLTMVESRSRKSVFLREAARAVSLTAQVMTARYEDLLNEPEFSAAFGVLTIRAVRVDENSVQQLSRFVSSNGSLLLFQSSELQPPPGMTSARHQLTLSSAVQVVTLGSVPRGT